MNILRYFAVAFVAVFFLWLTSLVDLFWSTFAVAVVVIGLGWLQAVIRPTSARTANAIVVVAVVFGVAFIFIPITASIYGYFFPRTAAVAKIAKADRDLKIAEAIRPGSFAADRAWATFCEKVAQINEGNLESTLQKLLGEVPEDDATPAAKMKFQKDVGDARHAIDQIRGWRADCAMFVAGKPAAFHWRFALVGLFILAMSTVPAVPAGARKYLVVGGVIILIASVAIWLFPQLYAGAESVATATRESGLVAQVEGLRHATIPPVGAMNPFVLLLLFVVVGVALCFPVGRGVLAVGALLLLGLYFLEHSWFPWVMNQPY